MLLFIVMLWHKLSDVGVRLLLLLSQQIFITFISYLIRFIILYSFVLIRLFRVATI
jgi:hypothetical protein